MLDQQRIAPTISYNRMDSHPVFSLHELHNGAVSEKEVGVDDSQLVRTSEVYGNELASAQHDLLRCEQQLQFDIDIRHRRSPKSDFIDDVRNEEKLSQVKNFNMVHDETNISQISDMTFFSRVIDDIQYYHSFNTPYYQNQQNVGCNEE